MAWQGVLRRHLASVVLIKLAALALLWALFFSPAHRPRVDPQTVGQRLAAPAPVLGHD